MTARIYALVARAHAQTHPCWTSYYQCSTTVKRDGETITLTAKNRPLILFSK
ncbi:MAG: hypothetical protein ACLRS3_06200 [Veillonella parvula]